MTRRALVLHLLREAGPDRGVTTAELLQAGCGSRYGARLLELRQAGHVIETERVREGSYRYRLTVDAERAAKATTEGVMPGTSSLSASDASLSSPSAPVLFEVPPVGPRNALLDDEAA